MSSQATKGDPSKATGAPAQLESTMSSVRSSSLYATSIFALLVSIVAFYFLKPSLNAELLQAKGTITDWVKPGDKSGEFKRQASSFRNWISSDANAEFPAEKGRYHLYVSYACPWGEAAFTLTGERERSADSNTGTAHRTLIVRKLKGLEDIIPFTSVHWHMAEKGWRFATKDETVPGENTTPDPLHPNNTHLRDLYFAANANYEGRFTVPTLWDKKKQTIVSNESSEIIRMFYTAFDDLVDQKYRDVVLFPDDLRDKIEEVNGWTYDDINNGVYKSGFATTQEAYEKNVVQLFQSLDRTEQILAEASSRGPYYFGDRLTEADVRLYTTIVRFDPVYVQHFKCNLRDVRSGYPHLHRWLRHLYWTIPAFGETTQFEHIKNHYTKSHKQINPFGITPVGPVPDILKQDEEVGVVKKAVA
ncbi:Glutathione S-transferase omega-like 2 [Cladophialophora carrionii]|uniref:Glutathione S-transferase omega-like 2 n=1 Tax=Cladophialophora carrionii TaxID=86049 RepID=A0A1C1C879_9EURO|nr:Glutathione S-transferase omega-like 2 [Cladophialophora carrionii]